MKAIEKVTGVSVKDISNSIPVLKEAYDKAVQSYFERTHPKLKMLDSFMIFCLACFFF